MSAAAFSYLVGVAITVGAGLAWTVLERRHRHLWLVVEVAGLPRQVIMRQRCAQCLRWRFIYDDGRPIRGLEARMLEHFRVAGVVKFRSFGANPVESRHKRTP